MKFMFNLMRDRRSDGTIIIQNQQMVYFFFMEMGVVHQCFLTHRNHQEERQSLLGIGCHV